MSFRAFGRRWAVHPALIGITAVLTAAAGFLVAVPRSHADTPIEQPFATRPDHVAHVTVVALSAPEAFRRDAVLRADITPPRPGDRVVFQQMQGGSWTTVASAPQDASGRAVAHWRAAAGAHVIRAAVFSTPTEASRASEPAPVVALASNARVVTWREWIEPGITGPLAAQFAPTVAAVLADPRGWASSGRVWFRHITSGEPDLWARLATPATTDRLCLPADTQSWWSCRNSDAIVINSDRWFHGSPSWSGPVTLYRALVVNHEVGHYLGFAHAACPARGRQAPVMMQQSKGLNGCGPNPWPLRSEIAELS